MKHIARVCLPFLLFLSLTLPLGAKQVWPQAVPLVENENMKFEGHGCTLSDGSYVLVWSDVKDLIFKIRSMRYSATHQELWAEPVVLAEEGRISEVKASSDGGFTLLTIGSIVRIQKYNASGHAQWDGLGFLLETYGSNYRVLSAEDEFGGLWVLSCEDAGILHCRYVTPDGTMTNTQGLSLSYGSFAMGLTPCTGGGAIVSYYTGQQNWLAKVSTDLVIDWQCTIPGINTQMGVILIPDTQTGFYVIGRNQGLRVWHYDYDGQSLWDEVLSLTEDSSSYSEVITQTLADGTMRVAGISNDYLRFRSFNASGDLTTELYSLEMPSTTWRSLGWYPYQGPNNPAFISLVRTYTGFNYEHCLIRVDDNGFIDTQPVLITIVQNANHTAPNPWYCIVNGELRCVYQRLFHDQAQIEVTSIDCNLNLTTQVLRGGPFGYISDISLAVSGQSILGAWLDFDDLSSYNNNYSLYRVRYQLYDSSGSELLPEAQVIPASGTYSKNRMLKSISLPGGDVILFWLDKNAQLKIMGQRISSSGYPLWEPEGRLIIKPPTSPALNNYTLTEFGGDVYVACTTGPQIRLQKLVAGHEPMWGEQGICIVDNSLAGGDLVLLKLQSDFLVYGIRTPSIIFGYGSLGALRFDQEGSALPGFGDYGMIIESVQSAVTIDYKSSNLSSEGMVLGVEYGYYHTNPYGDVSIVFRNRTFKLLGLDGQITTYDLGVYGASGSVIGSDTEGFYVRSRSFSTAALSKFNYTGDLLWSEALSLACDDDDCGNLGAWQFENDKWLGIGLVRAENSNTIPKYYSFTSSGDVELPSDCLLDDWGLANALSAQLLSNELYVGMAMNGSYSNVHTHLYMQKLNTIPVSNADPISVPTTLKMNNSYPNPFDHETRIPLQCEKSGMASLAVYNLRGQKVKELHNGRLEKGLHTVMWDGTDGQGRAVANGVYILRLKPANERAEVSRILKLRK